MNKVFLIGRLVRDPELRYTSSNVPTSTFTLAVDRNFTNQNGEKEADFINIVVWKKFAENVKKYLAKGSLIAIGGRIQTRSYDNEKGEKRYVTEVVAEKITFLDTKKAGTQINNDNNSAVNEFENISYTTEMQQQFEYKDEDLPFN